MERIDRLIKRYGSRKLYDTKESSYVSFEKIANWIREGEVIKVIDKKTSEDLTGQVLTHIISEENKQGNSILSIEMLHDLIRMGGQSVSSGVEQIQNKVDQVDRFVHQKVGDFVQSSLEHLGPIKRMREEMKALRKRLDELESTLKDVNEDVK